MIEISNDCPRLPAEVSASWSLALAIADSSRCAPKVSIPLAGKVPLGGSE